jgi:putative nucleotidyltransferase with HDIG domain
LLIDGPPVRTPEPAPGSRKELDAPASVVRDYIAPTPGRHLPQMLLATTLVAVLPLAVSLVLRATGVISGWVSVGLAVAMSLAASTAGSAYWRKRGGHGEVLFSELLLWGWLRSWRLERDLANATRLLELVNAGRAERDELGVERREHLLRQLADALEGQDAYVNGHSRRVARHATMIARGMCLSTEEAARIRAAAAVHDIGKLLTPKAILNKPGRLTDAEFEVIKRHPVDGAEMVAALGDPELTRIVRHHHERLDGAGYPDRLTGEEIPLGARIIAVADTFDAITSARPYRAAAPHQRAIDILRKESGTQLDPDAVKAFLAYYSGNRPALVWAIITSSVRRLVAWLTGDPAAAATISAGKVAAATVATATIGAVAVASPVPVIYHARRPAVGHGAIVRPRGVATGLRRQRGSVSVTLPAGATRTTHTARAKPTPAKRASAKHSRRGAHAAAPKRSATKPATGNQPHSPAAGTGSGSPATPTSAGSGKSTTASNPSTAATPGAATTPQASNPTPAGQSQGSNANGNAYGHTKPLGNGHGNGVANGHGDTSSSPSSSGSQPSSAPAGPAPNSQGNQGNQGSNSGNSQGNGNGNQNQQASATATVTPAPATATTSQGNGHGNAGGNGHGG